MMKENLTIVAIDDIEDNLIIIKTLIEQYFEDAVVLTALNGKDGIELVMKEKPDMVFLDIIMPEMDGFEVCNFIKMNEEIKDTPIIFVTAAIGDKELKIRALEEGAEGFLPKPIDVIELIAQIRAMRKISHANKAKKNEKERLANLVEQRTAELRKSQQIAEAAKQAQSKFLANMSHEIRTPLNGILGMIELTMQTELNEEQYDNLSVAKASVDALATVINDILDYTKIEEGRLTITKRHLDFKKLITVISKLYIPIATKKDLHFVSNIDSHIPDYIVSDEVRLMQILSNLLSNAIKFTKDGYVELRVEELEGANDYKRIRFTVKDSGIGIPDDKKDLLFKRFSQIDDSTTKHYQGTGLGLVITKNLLELLDSQLDYKSVVNQGSEFWFDLEVETLSNENKSQVETESDNDLYNELDKQVKILIVDDDKVNLKLLSALLKKKGASVTLTSNGKDGVQAFKDDVFDLVFMDISMPVMNGYEAVKLMKEEQKNSKIIAMTAFALQGNEEHSKQNGFDDYISKPIAFDKIYEFLDKL